MLVIVNKEARDSSVTEYGWAHFNPSLSPCSIEEQKPKFGSDPRVIFWVGVFRFQTLVLGSKSSCLENVQAQLYPFQARQHILTGSDLKTEVKSLDECRIG